MNQLDAWRFIYANTKQDETKRIAKRHIERLEREKAQAETASA